MNQTPSRCQAVTLLLCTTESSSQHIGESIVYPHGRLRGAKLSLSSFTQHRAPLGTNATPKVIQHSSGKLKRIASTFLKDFRQGMSGEWNLSLRFGVVLSGMARRGLAGAQETLPTGKRGLRRPSTDRRQALAGCHLCSLFFFGAAWILKSVHSIDREKHVRVLQLSAKIAFQTFDKQLYFQV